MNILAWLSAGVAGWFWVRALLPPRQGEAAWIRCTMEAALGLAFGAGGSAAAFFLLLWAGLRPSAAAWAADAAVLAAGLALWLSCRRNEEQQAPARAAVPVPFAWLAGIAAVGCLVAFLAATLVYLRANPQGDWDAWASWNVRARFLVHEGMWKNAVSPETAELRPELPLLWPAAVARAWAQSGNLEQAAPQAGAFFVSVALVALFGVALVAEAGWQWACLGLLCLFSMVPLWRAAPGQYPDVPLTLFVLGATVAAMAGERARWHAGALALSGLLGSFAAFTRNEGIAFAVCLGVALAAVARRRAIWWLAGALPGLLLTALFHALLAPQSETIRRASLLSFSRFVDTLAAFAAALWRLGEFPAHPLLFLLILYFAFRPAGRPAHAWALIPPALLPAAGFFLAWGAPPEAPWQSSLPADRYLLHAAPALLLPVLAWLGTSGAEAPAADASGRR